MTKNRQGLVLSRHVFVSAWLIFFSWTSLYGQQEAAPPRIFLDKSPRIVAYQLKRLSNARLLQVERHTDHAKYLPVYEAILSRSGMSPDEQLKAAQALAIINDSSVCQELMTALGKLGTDSLQDQLTGRQIVTLLVRNPAHLAEQEKTLFAGIQSHQAWSERAGFAGLFALGQVDSALAASTTSQQTLSWLSALSLLSDQTLTNQLRPRVLKLLAVEEQDIQKAAIGCLGTMTNNQRESWELLSGLIQEVSIREEVVRALLNLGTTNCPPETSVRMVDYLVKLAEQTPAESRTTNSFTNAMQLADELLANLPLDSAKAYRRRLGETTVRVIQIHTVEEEMRYDIPYFVVEAGRSVQVVLKNEDLMGHNLVITTPGKLREVADLGLEIGPTGDSQGRQYVPDSEMVLQATNLVGPGQETRLTFDAPQQTGEYPYVCTFPRHWMRMYGVMLVVDDLDEWLQKPVPPADPLGIKRTFVQNWTTKEFTADELADSAAVASLEKGSAHFIEATCSQCHQANGQGGKVGPSLNGVLNRWKDDRVAVLREILEPSHRIDPKYAVHLVINEDGESFSGIVASETKQSISLLENPESDKLTVIPRSEILEMVRTSTSMMPKGLLDRYERAEILELLSYITSLEETAPNGQ